MWRCCACCSWPVTLPLSERESANNPRLNMILLTRTQPLASSVHSQQQQSDTAVKMALMSACVHACMRAAGGLARTLFRTFECVRLHGKSQPRDLKVETAIHP